MKLCKQCGYEFSPVSARFYCCDKSEPVCITCRRQICKKCKKPRTSEVIPPRCDKCYSRLHQTDLLFEYTCDKYFCAKCLSNIFKNAYSEVSIERLYDQKNHQIFAKLYCGHQYPYNDLLAYFQHFCLQCGRSYDLTLDYQLDDGAKLCFFCFKFCQQKYKNAFIKCIGCDSILQNSSKAQLINNQGMILCKFCVHQSKIQERSIEQSRKLIESRQKIQKNISESKIVEEKKQTNESTQKIKKSTSPLNKFLKKPSISQLKEKQIKRENSYKNNESNHTFSITSKFSNQMEQIDDELKKQLGLTKSVKMKKHLSNQTVVEHFKIDIPKNNPEQYAKCSKCNCKILNKVSYDLNQSQQKVTQSGSLVLFSQVQNERSRMNKSSQNICRVCYYKSSQRQKSIIDINKSLASDKMKSTMSRSSRIQPSQSNMSYLKVNNSPKRGMHHSPSPSPNKQYSLTGSKHSSHSKGSDVKINITPSKIKVQQSIPYKPQQRKFNPIPTISQSYKQPTSLRQDQKCGVCGQKKKTLIMTIRQGHVCEECYYRKNPHSNIKR